MTMIMISNNNGNNNLKKLTIYDSMILISYAHSSLSKSLNNIDIDLRTPTKTPNTTWQADTRHKAPPFLGTPNIHMRPSGMFLYSHLRNLDANPNGDWWSFPFQKGASCHKLDKSSWYWWWKTKGSVFLLMIYLRNLGPLTLSI